MKNKPSTNEIRLAFDLTESQAKQVKFHCEVCPYCNKCEYAYDMYNTYGGGLIDTGCLSNK